MKRIWMLLLLPFSLLAQSNQTGSTGKADHGKTQFYTFHLLTMEDFLTTKPDNGGQAIYKRDTSGLRIDGEIQINTAGKFIEIIYTADKKHPMKAIIDNEPKNDPSSGTNTYTGLWTDTNEKTEITTIAGESIKIIEVKYGPHKGTHADYWDRIYKYYVSKKG